MVANNAQEVATINIAEVNAADCRINNRSNQFNWSCYFFLISIERVYVIFSNFSNYRCLRDWWFVNEVQVAKTLLACFCTEVVESFFKWRFFEGHLCDAQGIKRIIVANLSFGKNAALVDGAKYGIVIFCGKFHFPCCINCCKSCCAEAVMSYSVIFGTRLIHTLLTTTSCLVVRVNFKNTSEGLICFVILSQLIVGFTKYEEAVDFFHVLDVFWSERRIITDRVIETL